jgi:hypothetical protein
VLSVTGHRLDGDPPPSYGGVKDSRFPRDNWHREGIRQPGRLLTICGTPIDFDVAEFRDIRPGTPGRLTCPVCWAKR